MLGLGVGRWRWRNREGSSSKEEGGCQLGQKRILEECER